MANKRMISKSISTSERVNDCSLQSAFLFTWLIPHCDDWGRMNGSPRKVRAIVCPMRDDLLADDVAKCLQELADNKLINWYKIDDKKIIQVIDWWDHQTISDNKRAESKYPEYAADCDISQETPRNPKKVKPKLTKEKLREVKLSKDNLTDFEIVWFEYPKKIYKQKALKAFNARLKEKHTLDDLLFATRNYAKSCINQEEKYIQHPATFFGPDKPFKDWINPAPIDNQSPAIKKLQQQLKQGAKV